MAECAPLPVLVGVVALPGGGTTIVQTPAMVGLPSDVPCVVSWSLADPATVATSVANQPPPPSSDVAGAPATTVAWTQQSVPLPWLVGVLGVLVAVALAQKGLRRRRERPPRRKGDADRLGRYDSWS